MNFIIDSKIFFTLALILLQLKSIRNQYVNSENCGLKPALNYIVGGERAVRNEFPFLVIIKLNGNTVCGGAIIDDIWVITAAHCFKDREHQIADYSVHAGAHSLRDGEEYRLQLIRVHSKFSFGEMNSDVCLIKMDRNFNFGPHVGPVCLPIIQRAEVSGVITVAGWGRLIEKGTPSKILQKVNLPIITDEQCASMYQDKAVVIFRSHFCTYLEGYDTCEGDSGGPAFQFQNGRFTLIGIVSFGWECADTHPGVYTQVSYFLDWISQSMQ